MNKDGKACPAHSFCDLCGKRAVAYDGELLVCEDHRPNNEKRASAESSFKAAPLTMADKHR